VRRIDPQLSQPLSDLNAHFVADPCSFSSRDNRLVIFTITPACLTILFSIQHAMLML
jgi:hypothetical protein